MNFLKDRRLQGTRKRERRSRHSPEISSCLTFFPLSLSFTELPLVVSSHLRTSFVSAASPSVFHTRLFARAFRHLTLLVSRHRRGCPTATKDFARRYWWYARKRKKEREKRGKEKERETSGPFYLWSTLLSFPFLLHSSCFGSNIAKVRRYNDDEVNSLTTKIY